MRRQLERLASKSSPQTSELLKLVLDDLGIPPGGVRKLWQRAQDRADAFVGLTVPKIAKGRYCELET